MIVLILRRRFHPPTIEEFRENIERSENVAKTAQNISQLIEQHGDQGWLEQLERNFGPMFLMQLDDLANFLEILRK